MTDDIYVYIGHNNSLWKIFQDYKLEKFSELVAPLLTIWCCAHQSSLAWKAARNKYQKLTNMLMTLSGIFIFPISSYLAKSGCRCRELINISE